MIKIILMNGQHAGAAVADGGGGGDGDYHISLLRLL